MEQGAAASKWARQPSSDEEETQRKKKREKRFKKSRDSPAFREGSGTPTSSASGRTPREADQHRDSALRYETTVRSESVEPAEVDNYVRAGSAVSTPRESVLESSSQMQEYRITIPDAPQHPVLAGCRSVENYEKLNRISEGSYGVVYRARDRITGEIVALKKLKLDQEKNGFPITSLREIYTLLLAKHPHIVNVREIVVGDKLTQIFIVMDFIEHDLKELMSTMKQPFLQSEVKTLMLQLLSATELLHENWILHRDLKTSNLLLNNQGEIKVADFGLARRYGEPQGLMTQPVVTLWYRAPELLLGSKQYTTAIDIWSIGCIFAEFVNNEPLLPGRSEAEQLEKIFKLLGVPNDKIWPGYSKLPFTSHVPNFVQPYNLLRSRLPYLTENGLDLMSRMLTYDPVQRITAEEALQHPYFSEAPPPKHPSMFPTWPSKGERTAKRNASPSAPQAAHGHGQDEDEAPGGIFNFANQESTGFRLKV
ncbi:kinase-like domain-containing protein [Gamsiella multidivaricata]|uniref:kinase-like domain-containing protein n=1 Tax=Gamsiella multidivaricata TaxID=101098 RepID=UPI00221FBD60|nr:kinase-like domain-containing protein [Gamsiella multidivaricata]KAG0370546.1 hypothetical protein BGZ54_005776 [Gamsiella multidivaricata]KAI7818313.1 kinase-like domain-containing protein [Gamsiella multidivaricata]